MKRIHSLCALSILTAVLSLPARADSLLPTTGELNPPSGDLVGYAGQTLIWGLTMVNTDPNGYWWVITSVEPDYVSTGAPGEIPDGANFFTDDLSTYFALNFLANGTALAPGEDINVNSPGDPVDLASFAISPTADPGTVTAELHIVYDVFDNNPFDPNNPGNQIGGDLEFDVNTSVTVLAGQQSIPTSVPEPGTLALGSLAIGLLMALRPRKAAWHHRQR